MDVVEPKYDQSLLSAYESRVSEANKSCCDYGMTVTVNNYDSNTLEDIKTLTEKGNIFYK